MNKEILKKVQQIDLLLRRKVNSLFSGNYQSAFKGQGMIFSDFREYIPGDDVRSISWNLTAKMSHPYVKTFEEDREAQVILAVDISASMDFGTGKQSKKEVLQLISSLVAFCTNKSKDFLGLVLFSDNIELYIPPKKGLQHTFRIVREICAFQRKRSSTDIGISLSFLQKVLKKKSHIFFFSHFLTDTSFKKPLKILKQKHEVITVVVSDIFERQIPPLGLVDVEDIETGQSITLDFSSYFFQKEFKKSLNTKIANRKKQFLNSQCEQIFVDCQKDIYQPFIEFFQKRIHRV